MKTFSELKNAIAARVNKETADFLDKIGTYLNIRYEMLWNSYLWKELVVFDRAISTTAGDRRVVLPEDIEDIIALSDQSNGIVLQSNSPYVFTRSFIASSSTGGVSYDYVRSGYSPTKTILSSASAITVVSSSASDGQTIRVVGRNANNVRVEESITLTGTTAVTGTVSFTSLEGVSKSDDTAGIITISAGATVLDYLSAYARSNRYMLISLHFTPSESGTLYVTGKKRFVPMVDDNDYPLIPVEGILFHQGVSEALRAKNMQESAQTEESVAAASLESLLAIGQQRDNISLTIPQVYRNEEDSPIRGY